MKFLIHLRVINYFREFCQLAKFCKLTICVKSKKKYQKYWSTMLNKGYKCYRILLKEKFKRTVNTNIRTGKQAK